MKLGLVSAILGDLGYEEMIDFVSQCGLQCVEVACWPQGKAVRRYAGVSHIDVDGLTEERAKYLVQYAKDRNVTISSLAYYPNMLDPNLEKRQVYIDHFLKVICAADMMHIGTVASFIGRLPDKSVEDNLPEVEKVWKPILRAAEEHNVRIAIENCPMLFTNDEWPGGQNLMTSPANWRTILKLLDSPYLGINYDPSHFIWQQIDYIKPIYEFRDRIFHVHCKDIKLYPEKLADVGTMATPLQYMSPTIPGLGDVDWGRYISALTDIGYEDAVCIEIEDKSFEKSTEDAKRAVQLSARYLKNFVI